MILKKMANSPLHRKTENMATILQVMYSLWQQMTDQIPVVSTSVETAGFCWFQISTYLKISQHISGTSIPKVIKPTKFQIKIYQVFSFFPQIVSCSSINIAVMLCFSFLLILKARPYLCAACHVLNHTCVTTVHGKITSILGINIKQIVDSEWLCLMLVDFIWFNCSNMLFLN